MLYADLTTALAILSQQNDQTGLYTFIQSPDFATFLPRIIEAAEGRCYRELVPLATRNSTASAKCQAGLRTLPLGLFSPQPVVVEGIALITPVNTAPSQGTRWQYEPASIDFIDWIWPTEATAVAPSATNERYWALLDSQTVVLGPTPDQAYTAEATGIFRPTPLSAQNNETYLTEFYPDVFVAACMIEVAGFQRDYGAQSEDPKLAVSWQAQYDLKKASAIEEEQRRRGQGPSQSTLPPAPETKARRS